MMFVQRWGIPLLALLLLVGAGGAAACGGDAETDEDKIEARMKSFVEHLTKGDAKALINDLPPAARSGCDEAKIKEAAKEFSQLKFTLKETDVTEVNGNNATANITSAITSGDTTDEGSGPQKFIKVNGTWYLDPEGKPCSEFLG